jgi:hypothetical protein
MIQLRSVILPPLLNEALDNMCGKDKVYDKQKK